MCCVRCAFCGKRTRAKCDIMSRIFYSSAHVLCVRRSLPGRHGRPFIKTSKGAIKKLLSRLRQAHSACAELQKKSTHNITLRTRAFFTKRTSHTAHESLMCVCVFVSYIFYTFRHTAHHFYFKNKNKYSES